MVNDLVTKKIKQSADKIRPSLTAQQNDKLTSELQGLGKDLDDVMNSAKTIQEQLEKEFGLLKDYKNSVEKVSSILDRCKYTEDPIQNIAGLYFNVEKITLVQNDLLVSNDKNSFVSITYFTFRVLSIFHKMSVKKSNTSLGLYTYRLRV